MATNRYFIAVAGVAIQMALGAVYAWSVFRTPLVLRFGWSLSQVTLTFTISIFTLGVAAFFGGLWLNRSGPRVVALAGGLLYGSGVILARFSTNGLWWLYLTYGVIGGAGLGLGYIVPVAVLVKWFPDRRGLITGIAVGGFGAGALITAPLATMLIMRAGILSTFAYLGVAYLLVTVLAGWFMQNPPDGWQPRSTIRKNAKPQHPNDFSLREALHTWQWWALWVTLFLNTTAGISVISQEAPIFQELTHVSVAGAAALVGIVSIGNALGRVFWAWVSDLITRKATFVVMFLMQVVLFWILPGVTSVTLATLIAFTILMCYGGGFGTMPAFAADYFGATNVGPIYGLMLTAWGTASAFGPLLIAHTRETSGTYRGALHLIAVIVLVSTAVPLVVSAPRRKSITGSNSQQQRIEAA
ncbi:L-lactate MFS transporter [Candidatus Korobacter versatilis]|nr:OFA family MFS transporter [Candidatus Koribacter versatilis]